MLSDTGPCQGWRHLRYERGHPWLAGDGLKGGGHGKSYELSASLPEKATGARTAVPEARSKRACIDEMSENPTSSSVI